MKRLIYKELLEWKEKADRKPLILNGARQVGKTWILKEFARNEYQNLAYINCDHNETAAELFKDFDIDRILLTLSAFSGVNIEPENTLIFFDEMQEVPYGLTALKYFCENAPQYHIVVAGSLLGIRMHEGTGYPVGKVDEMTLYPLSFSEFLMATGNEPLLSLLNRREWAALSTLRERCIDLLRQYYYVGGMPEVVQSFVTSRDIKKVRTLQKRILSAYTRDFSKHAPSDDVPRIGAVWKSMPSQLAKENKKFIYGVLKKGARAREYESAIERLLDAGLLYRVSRVNKIEMPLSFYTDLSAFKLFVLDLGLLGAMADVPAQDVLADTKMLTEYKGAFTEQYICQQFIVASGQVPFYFSSQKTPMEIDFVVQLDMVYPIEVKAMENLRSKSLHTVLSENEALFGVRFSMSDYREQERMVNVPLYAAEAWFSEKMGMLFNGQIL